MLYNDAYIPVISSKHPRALGAPGHKIFPEVWDTIGPMLDTVLSRGEAVRADDLLLVLDRNGYPEECYFTFSYSPIVGETGGVEGVFTPVHETTERVINERRLKALSMLAQVRAEQSTNAESACEALGRAIPKIQSTYLLPPFICLTKRVRTQSDALFKGRLGGFSPLYRWTRKQRGPRWRRF